MADTKDPQNITTHVAVKQKLSGHKRKAPPYLLNTDEVPRKIQWHHPDIGEPSKSNFIGNENRPYCVSNEDSKFKPEELIIPDKFYKERGSPDGASMLNYYNRPNCVSDEDSKLKPEELIIPGNCYKEQGSLDGALVLNCKSISSSIDGGKIMQSHGESIKNKTTLQSSLQLAFSTGESDNEAMRCSDYCDNQPVSKPLISSSLQKTSIPEGMDPQHVPIRPSSTSISVPPPPCPSAESSTPSSNLFFTWHVLCKTNSGKSANKEGSFETIKVKLVPPELTFSKGEPTSDLAANEPPECPDGGNEQSSGPLVASSFSLHNSNSLTEVPGFDDSLDNICIVNETAPSDSMGLGKSSSGTKKTVKHRPKKKFPAKKGGFKETPLKNLDENPQKGNNQKVCQDSISQNDREGSGNVDGGACRNNEVARAPLKLSERTFTVLEHSMVRKIIHDHYSRGIAPKFSQIFDECRLRGLGLTSRSLASVLSSIGYKSIEYKHRTLLVEDCNITTERIKYLNKVEKYRGRNFVYIFVSQGITKRYDYSFFAATESTICVLHAMSDKRLLSGGFKVLTQTLGFREAVISWLKNDIMPQIPKGSVIIFGNHPVFNKNEDHEKPEFQWSKESIIDWLKKYKVTVKPNLPKSILLSKASNVILPNVSSFDKLVRQNGFVSFHLPEHHKELDPMEYLLHEVMDKLHQTPGIKSRSDLKSFVAKEFLSLDGAASRAACTVVEELESSYRDYDLKFDDIFDRVTGVYPTPKPKTSVVPEKQETSCFVCLHRSRMLNSWICRFCEAFWKRLCTKFDEGHPEDLPVCRQDNHVKSRPQECNGCRRFRYEQYLLQLPCNVKQFPNYQLPIPPVTEEGQKYPPIPTVIETLKMITPAPGGATTHQLICAVAEEPKIDQPVTSVTDEAKTNKPISPLTEEIKVEPLVTDEDNLRKDNEISVL